MTDHADQPTAAAQPHAVPGWLDALYSPLDDKLGIELLHVDPRLAIARMPVSGNTQPAGLLHGGASCVLAETLGSLAAYAYARETDRVPVGVDINATHHRPVRSGWVTGTATALHLARSLVTYEVVLTDDEGRRTCTARITCALVRPRRD